MLAACAGQTTFKPSERSAAYTKAFSEEILVVFEVSHLKKAHQWDADNSATPELAGNAVLKNISTEFSKVGINVTGAVVDTSADPASIAKLIAMNKNKKQILLIAANSFQTIKTTQAYSNRVTSNTWSGRLTWNLRLFDVDKVANPDGKSVWSATTDLVQFGPKQCNSDQYQTCAERFVSALVLQLKSDGLIK
jgi:hypothetical protein